MEQLDNSDVKYVSESEAERYALNAGFMVAGGNVASRKDMPGVEFHLTPVDGSKFYWKRTKAS